MENRDRNERGRHTETVTAERVLEAVRGADDPVVTAREIGSMIGFSPDAVRRKLDELHERDEIERKTVGGDTVVWWVRRPLDAAFDESEAGTILARLSNELDTTISLDDDTVYEDGDRHSIDESK